MNANSLANAQSGRGNMATGPLFFLLLAFFNEKALGEEDFPLLMPKARPQHAESYICTPVRLSDTQTFYVTGFTPNATAHTAHHMLVSIFKFKLRIPDFMAILRRFMGAKSPDRRIPCGIAGK